MKVTESAMLEAIRHRRNWRSHNTKVVRHNIMSAVYLFDKHIANVHDDGSIDVNERTLIAWPTVTTMSRLRALGVNVYQRKNRVYLDDVAIT